MIMSPLVKPKDTKPSNNPTGSGPLIGNTAVFGFRRRRLGLAREVEVKRSLNAIRPSGPVAFGGGASQGDEFFLPVEG